MKKTSKDAVKHGISQQRQRLQTSEAEKEGGGEWCLFHSKICCFCRSRILREDEEEELYMFYTKRSYTTLHKYYWSSRVTLSLQTNYKQMHHPLQVPPAATKTCGKTYNNGQHQESLMSHFFNQKAFYTCLITPMLPTFPIPQSQLSAKPHKPGFPDSLLPALPSLH